MEVRKHRVDVVERVRAVGVARHERHLPRRERRERLLDEFGFLSFERSDLSGHAYATPAFLLFEFAKFVDLLFKRFDIAFEFEKYLLGHLGFVVSCCVLFV